MIKPYRVKLFTDGRNAYQWYSAETLGYEMLAMWYCFDWNEI